MDCPRCGFVASGPAACPRCGVVFAKIRPRAQVAPAEARPSDAPPTGSPWTAILLLALGLCLATIAWLATTGRSHEPVRTTAPPEVHVAPASAVAPQDETAPLLEVGTPAPRYLAQRPGPMSAEDAASYGALVDYLNADKSVGSREVEIAAGLQARYPGETGTRRLQLETLIRAALREQGLQHFPQALAYLKTAAALPWADERPLTGLMNIYTQTADWAALEALAQEMIAANARAADAWYALGYALFRQDRAQDAVDALRKCLELGDHLPARLLLERIQKNVKDESGMTERRLLHFHVRYDGDEHPDVGQEILAALERHYATLSSTLHCWPRTTIPVILFSRERYLAASGAPAWSGGVFDHGDGRIRIPIGGLTRTLTPDMDNTLLHELTHAFIAEKAGDGVPREIHEGLAQYMAGDRVTDRLPTREAQAALAGGRIGGVWQFYLEALSFTEYLVSRRGMVGANDFLQTMGETHDLDEAFQQAYGSSGQELHKAWRHKMQQDFGD